MTNASRLSKAYSDRLKRLKAAGRASKKVGLSALASIRKAAAKSVRSKRGKC